MKLLLICMLLFTGCARKVQGPKGDEGPQGNPGVDATPVYTVPLCPGFTPTYPNSFPEFAVCIQKELYGVYSVNGGFLALLPPGTYNSNGINAICTVIIEEDCNVHQ